MSVVRFRVRLTAKHQRWVLNLPLESRARQGELCVMRTRKRVGVVFLTHPVPFTFVVAGGFCAAEGDAKANGSVTRPSIDVRATSTMSRETVDCSAVRVCLDMIVGDPIRVLLAATVESGDRGSTRAAGDSDHTTRELG